MKPVRNEVPLSTMSLAEIVVSFKGRKNRQFMGSFSLYAVGFPFMQIKNREGFGPKLEITVYVIAADMHLVLSEYVLLWQDCLQLILNYGLIGISRILYYI
jgi:hypothetical protein